MKNDKLRYSLTLPGRPREIHGLRLKHHDCWNRFQRPPAGLFPLDKMRLAVFSGRNAVYILEGAGKMQLVGIADLGCDLPDGHPRFFKQLGCTGHAVVQQICLRAFSYRIPKYLAEVASVESADGGNLLNGISR